MLTIETVRLVDPQPWWLCDRLGILAEIVSPTSRRSKRSYGATTDTADLRRRIQRLVADVYGQLQRR
jgi:hypothetical protein